MYPQDQQQKIIPLLDPTDLPYSKHFIRSFKIMFYQPTYLSKYPILNKFYEVLKEKYFISQNVFTFSIYMIPV